MVTSTADDRTADEYLPHVVEHPLPGIPPLTPSRVLLEPRYTRSAPRARIARVSGARETSRARALPRQRPPVARRSRRRIRFRPQEQSRPASSRADVTSPRGSRLVRVALAVVFALSAVARADAWAHNSECSAMLAGAGPGTKLHASASFHSARAVPVERGAVKTMLRVLLAALLLFASLASVSASWTSRASTQNFYVITSSSDGTKLAATVIGGTIWTSIDSGETWTSRASTQNWRGITSSSDGSKLAATVSGGTIWTSIDSGATWTSRASTQNWWHITSSSDGTKLAAAVSGGNIWTSTDSGETWTSRASTQNWRDITSSSDGTKLLPLSKWKHLDVDRLWRDLDMGYRWKLEGITSSMTAKLAAMVEISGLIERPSGRTRTYRTARACRAARAPPEPKGTLLTAGTRSVPAKITASNGACVACDHGAPGDAIERRHGCSVCVSADARVGFHDV